ncbi:helix-hairpin-helix domain-containing protein [Marinobacter goseongensis]|jgi:predicted flap endonuclease-1-like 5' DNA nuclease|uniref:helix-hairpin-helix domain-containing protein n=1 Tax=Marinobacter goseongensis TaxID=453838 RepID=UPI002005A8BE|nr:helix-hairpin-helix domain-containing protein [Marinobacter goseongensis]MCK7550175.1 helix-hairpin-helix domain-containing protein [Marinobacter goseongensis]
MGKKAKPSVDKIVKKVNKEFEKTSSQIESLINDALKQFDNLQNQVQEPVRKLLKEVDELRDREMKRFNDEFERRMSEFQELQNNVLERLGIAGKDAKKELKAASDAASAKLAETKPKVKAAAKTAAAKSPAKTGTKTAKKAPARKTPAKPAAKAAKPANKSDLTRVKGIGPATATKMQEAGITSIDQIANPSAADKEKLQAFAKMKGFATLSDEAKKAL